MVTNTHTTAAVSTVEDENELLRCRCFSIRSNNTPGSERRVVIVVAERWRYNEFTHRRQHIAHSDTTIEGRSIESFASCLHFD